MMTPTNLLLDSGIVGFLCHPARRINKPAHRWLNGLIRGQEQMVFLPEIVDYQVRRKLLHLRGLGRSSSFALDRLDELPGVLTYLPLDTATLRRAAALWAEARHAGWPTAAEAALDVDVILAAQTQAVAGTMITTNRKHLARFVPAVGWDELP